MYGGKLKNGIIEHAGANNPDWVSNIGINYVPGTGVFKICQADGLTDFNLFQPGWVTLPSALQEGKLVTLKVTDNTNTTFIDDVGASDIAGETFGVTAGVAWNSDMPFFLYAVNKDDTDSGLAFAIARLPYHNKTPVSTAIAFKLTPAADLADWDFFFPTPTDVTLTHNEKPCRVIGCFRMRKVGVAVDWTVQPLSNAKGDGIRSDNFYGQNFSFPVGQSGANAGSHFLAIAAPGTPPTWASEVFNYMITEHGIKIDYCQYGVCTNGQVGKNVCMVLPFGDDLWPQFAKIHIGSVLINGLFYPLHMNSSNPGSHAHEVYYLSGAGLVQLACDAFADAADRVYLQFIYEPRME